METLIKNRKKNSAEQQPAEHHVYFINTEKELFRQAALGKEHAFTRLYHKYVPLINRVFEHLQLRDEFAADDIRQDIFMALWKGREALAKVDTAESYIVRIARNRVYRYWNKRRSIRVLESEAHALTKQLPEDRASFKELETAFYSALSELSVPIRESYLVRQVYDFKTGEAAKRLGKNAITVKNQHLMAKKFIRKYVAEKLEVENPKQVL